MSRKAWKMDCGLAIMDILPLTAETESEKQIGVELVVQDDVLVGQNFTVTATVTNKTVSSRLACSYCCSAIALMIL